MKIRYHYPRGSSASWTRDVDLPWFPHVGDTVYGPDDNVYLVRTVIHYPFGDLSDDGDKEPHIYVVLKRPS